MKAQPVRIPFVMAQLRFGGRSGGAQQCGIGIRFCPH